MFFDDVASKEKSHTIVMGKAVSQNRVSAETGRDQRGVRRVQSQKTSTQTFKCFCDFFLSLFSECIHGILGQFLTTQT